jgi:hypothetical protein
LFCGYAAGEQGKLLSTSSLAKKVRATARLLSDSPPGTTAETRRRGGNRLRDEISQFIVAQVEAMPSISQQQLRDQLRKVLSPGVPDTDVESACDRPPYVFANVWGGTKGTSQFVIAYQLALGFMGPQSSIIVIESYTRDNNSETVRRTSPRRVRL